MTAGPQLDPQVEQVLVRIQQVLLHRGYRYLGGAVENWPADPVELARGSQHVILLPWQDRPADAEENFRQTLQTVLSDSSYGIVMVGLHDPESAQVRAMFQETRGALAYVQAPTRQYRVRKPKSPLADTPLIFNRRILGNVLNPKRFHKADKIDCRQRMQRDLQDAQRVHEFHKAVGQARGEARPTMTSIAVAALVIAFVATLIIGGGLQPKSDLLRQWGALTIRDVAAGQWWRMFSVVLLHGSVMHLAFNGYALFYLGGMLEAWQGRLRLGALFVFSALTASTLSLWIHTPPLLAVGASGAIFGLIGGVAAVVLRWRRAFPARMQQDLKRWLGTILLYNALFLVIPNIDWAAHLGGLIGGFVLGLVISRPPTQRQRLAAWQWAAAAVVVAAGIAAAAWVIAHLPGA